MAFRHMSLRNTELSFFFFLLLFILAGVIVSAYRGNFGVILFNLGKVDFEGKLKFIK